ncbi:MAG: hypothetical protein ABI571_05960, partial [Actinomycetota bacterium]
MKAARVIAWTLWAAFVVALAAAIYVGFHSPVGSGITVIDAIWYASFIGFPTAGALVAPRMPRRPLGWILLIAPLLLMVGLSLSELAGFPLQDGNPAAAWMLWGSTVLFSAGLAPLLIVPLYLPDGELPSSRWQPAGRTMWGFTAAWILGVMFKPGPLETSATGVRNPAGLEPLAGIFDVIETLLGPLALAAIAAGVVSLIIRFRGARGVARQQLKWLALGGAGVFV